MAVRDFSSQRLYVTAPLRAGGEVPCTPEQVNYLMKVLRLPAGAEILVFNGHDGEWRARLEPSSKRSAALVLSAQVRSQETGPDIDYLFAPLKHARLDYMVQKAAEMGVRRLRPVLTQHTVAERVNLERMRANAVEAAEQCGILTVPEVAEPVKLAALLAAWDGARPLIVCDEAAEVANPVTALQAIPRGPVAVIVGPEGGFSDDERTALAAKPFVRTVSLGPRILRADTAAVAVLALVNAVLGDWT